MDALQRDAEHVDYEIWMLMKLTERFGAPLTLPEDDIACRAMLESWLLHLRALYEFFKTHDRQGNDRRAVDYFEADSTKAAQIAGLAPVKDSWEDARIREIHKALAHIARGRSKLNTNWTERDLALVRPRLEIFFRVLDPARRPWFPRAARWFAAATQ